MSFSVDFTRQTPHQIHTKQGELLSIDMAHIVIPFNPFFFYKKLYRPIFSVCVVTKAIVQVDTDEPRSHYSVAISFILK